MIKSMPSWEEIIHGYTPYEIFYEVITGRKEKLEKLLEFTKPQPP